MEGCFIGIDVGTGSVRAAVTDTSGRILAIATKSIKINNPQENFFEQSSEDIWSSCCVVVKEALEASKQEAASIKGLGFDATCSLVVLDGESRPVSISKSGDASWNVIMWMDHRAVDQARRITDSKHKVLQNVGGIMSPEMETPKLLWLKENMPSTWHAARHFYDLPDFLTMRATEQTDRSLCSLVCKWTHLSGETTGWDESYFKTIGLGDLADEKFARIGTVVRHPGTAIPGGLSSRAAQELGLLPGTPVATSMIDAHAGGLGLFGLARDDPASYIAIIAGSSSCHMAVSALPVAVPGVWGPYFAAMVPGMWLSEGGQSAAGKLIDYIVFSHRAYTQLRDMAAGKDLFEELNCLTEKCAAVRALPSWEHLTIRTHILPYFHGNRSPLADPTLLGGISGLSLSQAPLDELCVLYAATLQALALGTRHIIEEMNKAGHRIRSILMCGGISHNRLFRKAHADATGCRVQLASEDEAVLLGASVLGAAASGIFASLADAMAALNRPGLGLDPDGAMADLYLRKFKVFRKMHHDQLQYRDIMEA